MTNQRIPRRAWFRLVGGAAVAGLAVACQNQPKPAPTPVPAAAPGRAAQTSDPSAITLTLANSELAVGQNRFAMGVLQNNRSIGNAAVRFEFFKVDGQTATKRAEADATYRTLDDVKGIYVARVNFDEPGAWGVQATVTPPSGAGGAARTGFEVLEKGHAPMPGARAIPSANPTARDVANLSDICSATPPCSMHDLSVKDALAQAKPSMIVFATPGYCTSQTCAPVLGEAVKVKDKRAAQASFVHVEIYKDPRNLVVADAVTEWGLQSEPWVFVVDRQGVIAERIESITTADELDAALARVL